VIFAVWLFVAAVSRGCSFARGGISP